MSDETDYIDIRDVLNTHTRIPCVDCNDSLLVSNDFALNHDEWYCRECLPAHLRGLSSHSVEVRI